MSIAFHAVRRAALTLGGTVAVLGCGVIELMIILAARLAGCGRITAVDKNERRPGFLRVVEQVPLQFWRLLRLAETPLLRVILRPQEIVA